MPRWRRQSFSHVLFAVGRVFTFTPHSCCTCFPSCSSPRHCVGLSRLVPWLLGPTSHRHFLSRNGKRWEMHSEFNWARSFWASEKVRRNKPHSSACSAHGHLSACLWTCPEAGRICTPGCVLSLRPHSLLLHPSLERAVGDSVAKGAGPASHSVSHKKKMRTGMFAAPDSPMD